MVIYYIWLCSRKDKVMVVWIGKENDKRRRRQKWKEKWEMKGLRESKLRREWDPWCERYKSLLGKTSNREYI